MYNKFVVAPSVKVTNCEFTQPKFNMFYYSVFILYFNVLLKWKTCFLLHNVCASEVTTIWRYTNVYIIIINDLCRIAALARCSVVCLSVCVCLSVGHVREPGKNN